MPTAHTAVAEFGDYRTLVVERFDRRWTKDGRLLRLPQEDMCQALSVFPTRKYQSEGGPGMRHILELLKGSDTPEQDIATFIRACILFWMLGATDGHARNFSIIPGPGGRFRLTPLYDVLTAQPSLDVGEIQHNTFKPAMSVGRKRRYPIGTIMPRHFLQTGTQSGVGEALVRGIFEDIAASVAKALDAVISEFPQGFPEPLVTSVSKALRHRSVLGAGAFVDSDLSTTSGGTA